MLPCSKCSSCHPFRWRELCACRCVQSGAGQARYSTYTRIKLGLAWPRSVPRTCRERERCSSSSSTRGSITVTARSRPIGRHLTSPRLTDRWRAGTLPRRRCRCACAALGSTAPASYPLATHPKGSIGEDDAYMPKRSKGGRRCRPPTGAAAAAPGRRPPGRKRRSKKKTACARSDGTV
jgi:hypothetical protein